MVDGWIEEDGKGCREGKRRLRDIVYKVSSEYPHCRVQSLAAVPPLSTV